MLCDKCKKNQADVHIQQFVNGKKVELHLCQQCSFQMDSPEMMISFENIFKGFLEQLNSKYLPKEFGKMGNVNMTITRPTTSCSRCGMTYDQFKTGGKLGCDICYQSFAKEVGALLKSVQGSTHHEGKYPRRLGAGLIQKRQVDDLRTQLKKAVSEENYEEAARLRDEIKAIDMAEGVGK